MYPYGGLPPGRAVLATGKAASVRLTVSALPGIEPPDGRGARPMTCGDADGRLAGVAAPVSVTAATIAVDQ
jgi:hypothetical protein